MVTHRCYVPPNDVQGAAAIIRNPSDIHHLKTVLRLKSNDVIRVFNGEGMEWEGVVERMSPRAITVRLGQPVEHEANTMSALTLAPAVLGKPARFEWVVEKATELGVAAIAPVLTERTLIKDPDDVSAARRQRWQRIMQAAAEQCHRPTLPELRAVQRLTDMLTDERLTGRKLLLSTNSKRPLLSQVLRAGAASHILLVGPEGDFAAQELALAGQHHWEEVSLGPWTLRGETAGVAAVAVLQHLSAGGGSCPNDGK